MQRPIRNRTMLSTKESENNNSTKNQPELNYCPLPIMNSKKQEVHKLLAEYNELDSRIIQIKKQLEQLGFGHNQ